MSRVTAIPHLIHKDKMVSVIKALYNRAPLSTETVCGKKYIQKRDFYFSQDGTTSDGKTIVELGYLPMLPSFCTKYGEMKERNHHEEFYIEKTNFVEYIRKNDIQIISADLPFFRPMYFPVKLERAKTFLYDDIDIPANYKTLHQSRNLCYRFFLDDVRPYAANICHGPNVYYPAISLRPSIGNNLISTITIPKCFDTERTLIGDKVWLYAIHEQYSPDFSYYDITCSFRAGQVDNDRWFANIILDSKFTWTDVNEQYGVPHSGDDGYSAILIAAARENLSSGYFKSEDVINAKRIIEGYGKTFKWSKVALVI